MSDFRVGDRVGAKGDVLDQVEFRSPTGPGYGHVVDVQLPLVWVRDRLGVEWGLPASVLESID